MHPWAERAPLCRVVASRRHNPSLAPAAVTRGNGEARRVRDPLGTPLLLIAIILCVGVLYVARIVFIPVAIGVCLALLLWPLYERLGRHVPRWLAAGGAALVVLAAFAAITAAIWYAAATTIRTLAGPGRDLYGRTVAWLQGRGIDLQLLGAAAGGSGEVPSEPTAGGSGEVPTELVARAVSFLTGGLGALAGVVVVLALAVFLMLLALTDASSMRRRAERALGRGRAERIADALHEASSQFRMTVLGMTIGGVIAGTLVAGWCWAMGVPHPLAWGVLALLLNYVPNVGAYLSGAPPAVMAFATLGVGPALVFVAGLFVIETVQGNLIEPLIAGRVLSLSPLFVLVSLIFWAWLWGAAGAVLCVPLSAALVVVLKHIPGAGHCAVLLAEGDGGRARGRAT